MASKKTKGARTNPQPNGPGTPRAPRAEGSPAFLDALNVRRAAWTLLDLASAWELAVASGMTVDPDAPEHEELLRVVGHLHKAAERMRQEFAGFAFAALVDVIAELYVDRADGSITDEDLRRLLAVAWEKHPATQLVLARLTQDTFVKRFALPVTAPEGARSIRGLKGPVKAALTLLAEVFGKELSTGFNLRRRPPNAVPRPFGMSPTDRARTSTALGAIFPDVDARALADLVMEGVRVARGARGGPPDEATVRQRALTMIPWPSAKLIAELEAAHDAEVRFELLGTMFEMLALSTPDAVTWASARYVDGEGDSASADDVDAEYRVYLSRRREVEAAAGEEHVALIEGPTRKLTEREEDERRVKIQQASAKRWRPKTGAGPKPR